MSLADEYIRHGWRLCAIPAGTKGPSYPGWNEEANALTTSPPEGFGIGLMHAYSGTCALDIDDIPLTREYLGAPLLFDLMTAPDAVQIVSGRPNRAKLLYRTPLGMALPSKKIVIEKDGVRTVAFELRCAASNGKTVQDVLPPSVHPDTGKPYVWKGDWRNLPELPPALLDLWNKLLQEDSKRNVPMGEGALPASMEEVRSMLFAVSPDCDRKTWVDVGMALEHLAELTGKQEECFTLFDTWSAGSKKGKYDQRTTATQWKSFKPRPDGITLGTLFYHARCAGWKRPVPDVSELFSPIKPVSRAEVESAVNERVHLPEQNLKLWPDILVRRSTEVAKEVGCDVTVPLMAGLMAVSGAVDHQTRLRLTNTWTVPPVLWTMTIGDPSDKKTPGCKPMFAPLRALEVEQRATYEAEMMVWLGKEARYAAESKAYREWCASPEAQLPNAVPPNLTPLPPQPEPLRLLISDTTSQKLVHMSQHRPQGFLNFMDEMANWLKKISDPRGGDDRGCWIQGYETGPYTMDRVGSGTIHTDNLAMSVFGNCQPDVFRQYGSTAATDGLLQRFLPVVLNTAKNAMWSEGLPSWISHASEYEQLIRRTFGLPKFEYQLSEKGMQTFRRYCEWCLDFRRIEKVEGVQGTYMTALGKLEGQCARMILLFHIIENPYSPIVDAATVDKAVNLLHKFFMPMLRYVYFETAGQRDRTGEAVFNHLLQLAGVVPTITLGALKRAVRLDNHPMLAPWQSDAQIKAAMYEMAEFGFVAIMDDRPTVKNPVWTINPAMAQQFKSDREAIIRNKQRRVEAVRANLTNEGRNARIWNAVGWTPEMA